LSSHDTTLVAVGENSQYRTQLLCCFKVYCSLRSTVDHIFTNLSSPQEESSSPSQEKPIARILALWALIKVTSFAFVSKLTSQNFKDSSLEAETSNEPVGLNLRSWIWFWISWFKPCVREAYSEVFAGWDPRAKWHCPFLQMRHICRLDVGRATLLIICVL
jgi:hypothetical protein